MSRDIRRGMDRAGMDRGPKEQKSHLVEREGEIMKIASRNIICASPQMPVKSAAALMDDSDVRRLPVIDAGNKKLLGMATAIDIIDFLGGGEKYNILEKDYGGNFLSAINSPIQKIIRHSRFLEEGSKVDDAINIVLNERTSCIPIVEDADSMEVVGIVTEQDILPHIEGDIGVAIQDVMNKKPLTTTSGTMLGDVAKIMVRNQLRRIPVIKDDQILGVITAFDILKYLKKGDYKGVFAQENLETRAKELMSPDVVIMRPYDDLSKAVNKIRETGYGGFPVAKDEGIEGIITTTDILKWIYSP
jgi:CBS domain-containing protein